MTPPPYPRRPAGAPAPTPAKDTARCRETHWRIAAAALLLTLAGCAQLASTSQGINRQVEEATCIGRCRDTKDRCDDKARWDYQQCQSGYSSAQSDYLWCNSADQTHCGYPWWSCSQNLYGYCTNRYWECRSACRSPRR